MPNNSERMKDLVMIAKEIKENGYEFLRRLLLISDTDKFEAALNKFIRLGVNINDTNDNGNTILDLCNFLPSIAQDQARRKELIIALGGKSGAAVSDIASQMVAASVIPGMSDLAIFEAISGFSYEDKELRMVSEFRVTPVCNSSYQNSVNVCEIFDNQARSIGKLFDDGNFVSTLFLIKDDWVITARHSVNYCKLQNLTVMFNDSDFDESLAIPVAGVIENGEIFNLDYIVLKLSRPVNVGQPLVVSLDITSTSLMFIGYDSRAVLRFSAFPDLDLGNVSKLRIVGYQGTGACFSGSPYINLDGEASGLHSCASSDHKTGIYFKTIIDMNPNGGLARLSRRENVSDVPLLTPIAYFPKFSIATAAFEFDERDKFNINVNMSTGTAVFSATGGPNNQSGVGVKKKIAERLYHLQAAGKTLTDVQTRFLAIGGNYANTSAHNIQIAHNIAISALRDALESKMNNPIAPADEAAEITAAQNFADALASSDDDDPTVAKRPEIKKKLPKFVRNIRIAQKKAGGVTLVDADALMADCKEILSLCNKSSRNLMPGHAEVNEHEVRDCRDPHLTKTAAGAYEETDVSKTLARTAAAFFGCAHEPKKKADGSGDVASSSVDSGNVRDQAYYRP